MSKHKIFSGTLTRANPTDAGLDIRASETDYIEPNQSKLISTNLRVGIAEGYVGLIKSRSGLSVKHNLEVGAGVIDSAYRGEVKVHLYNFGSERYTIEAGDRIAQMLILPVDLSDFEEAKMDKTSRGEGGFGSSGKN